MIRTLLRIPVFIAVLVLVPMLALADHHGKQEELMHLDEIFDQLDLTEEKRAEVQEVMKQFREDRRQAGEALRELSKTLPPHEEITAMRVYADIVLESRLKRVLSSQQVAQIMAYLEEQRGQRETQEKENMDSD